MRLMRMTYRVGKRAATRKKGGRPKAKEFETIVEYAGQRVFVPERRKVQQWQPKR